MAIQKWDDLVKVSKFYNYQETYPTYVMGSPEKQFLGNQPEGSFSSIVYSTMFSSKFERIPISSVRVVYQVDVVVLYSIADQRDG